MGHSRRSRKAVHRRLRTPTGFRYSLPTTHAVSCHWGDVRNYTGVLRGRRVPAERSCRGWVCCARILAADADKRVLRDWTRVGIRTAICHLPSPAVEYL